MSHFDEELRGISKRVRRSCKNCHRSHVKCDEVKPCGHCTARGFQCVAYVRRRDRKSRKKHYAHSEDTNSSVTEFIVEDLTTEVEPNFVTEELCQLSESEYTAIRGMVELDLMR